MTKKLKLSFKSDAFEAIHSAVSDMHRAGTVSKTTLREFDAACVSVPPKIAPKTNQADSRKKWRESTCFARYLNTSESTIEK